MTAEPPRRARPAAASSDAARDLRPSARDLRAFAEGTHTRLYRRFGAHPATSEGIAGTHFAVWAPGAEGVSVVSAPGNEHPLTSPSTGSGEASAQGALARLGGSGVWAGFVPGLEHGARYQYAVRSASGAVVLKSDPLAFRAEQAPATTSVVWDLAYDWGDRGWMASRGRRNARGAPISIYEVHLGSWRRVESEGGRALTYREHAEHLVEYVVEMGFTHVELLPVMEHPFYGSWGYQVTGYFAATSRYGTPQDLMYLIDTLHQRGVGVILDWVPAHFPEDEHALAMFNGTSLYEHADPRRGRHPDWRTSIFDYGRPEVRSFLISSALFWLDRFHIDGLRVDAVSSMLYLDYSRKAGEWEPNAEGGREHLEAVAFVRQLNAAVARAYPAVLVIAEEATAWPGVTAPAAEGGLGFDLKWDMGWMHDTLRYLALEPAQRRERINDLTFRGHYAFNERFLLPLSHDEVVHGKYSLLGRMPGDNAEQFANLRTLFAYMYLLPGKKLLFMGNELGQPAEWGHDGVLAWELLQQPAHRGVQTLVRDLNAFYRERAALHASDLDPAGFEWLDARNVDDRARSVLSFVRRDPGGSGEVLAVFNFSAVEQSGVSVGVDRPGAWQVALNSDERSYGGAGRGSSGNLEASAPGVEGRAYALLLDLPPLGALALVPASNSRRALAS